MSNGNEEVDFSFTEKEISNHEHDRNPVWMEVFKWVVSCGLIVSSVCLILYLIAFSKVPELKKHTGKKLVSLCVAFLLECISAIFLVLVFTVDSNACIPVTWITYYFSMANNLWMCLIGFDIWRNLRGTLSKTSFSSGKQSSNNDVCYSLIGWLLPALALAVVMVIDIMKPAFVLPYFVPEIGKYVCWFNQFYAEMLFYTGPIFLLLSLSTMFLILASLTLSTRDMSKATYLATISQQIQLYPFAVLVTLIFIVRILEIINLFLAITYINYGTLFLKSTFGVVFFVGFTCTGNARAAMTEYMSKGSSLTLPNRQAASSDYHPIKQPSDETDLELKPSSVT